MPRSPLADSLREAQRLEVRALSPGERVLLALELGRRSLAFLCARSGLPLEQALAERAAHKQRRRQVSACAEASR